MSNKEIKRYRVISKEIVEDDLSEQEAQIVYDMYTSQGRNGLSIEKIPVTGLGRDPDLY
jgi:hypothetical protein|tara:strand:- start:839 stop:1015 length:177 start_codon:yes stop_codon:yes gene_type:complete